MNAKLQVYVAKPVYSDQLKKKKQNTMTLVLGPDWRFTRLQATRPSSGPHYFWLWRQEWMGARAEHEKARKTHEERANGGPSKQED